MKVNIGKNTLGDSDKMSLSLREYGRSTHNLSYAWRSTMGVGALTPFMKILALPGDTFEINLENKILTAPTIGPLFGSFKFQADLFTCPIRLYNAMLHNNALNIGLDMSKVKLPKIQFDQIKGNEITGGTSTSSLRWLMGYKEGRRYNAVPILAYYDIFKNYYANKQEKKFAMYSGVVPQEELTISDNTIQKLSYGAVRAVFKPNKNNESLIRNTIYNLILNNQEKIEVKGDKLKGGLYNGEWVNTIASITEIEKVKASDVAEIENTGYLNPIKWIEVKQTAPSVRKIEKFDLEQIDDLREYILSKGKQEVLFDQNYKINDFLNASRKKETTKEDLGGLCLKTYQSDINNNWISSEWTNGENGIANLSRVDTTSGSFTIDTLNLAKKVYEMLNRIAISGGTYKDWIETVYTTDYYFRAETPVYEGGMSSEIEFEEIVSNAASEVDGYEPLGTLAGRGINTSKKGGNIIIKVNEPCYIIGIASITPRVDYSLGVPFDLDLNTLNDIHKPQLDGIGYEDRLLRRLDWRAKDKAAIGKQPAWIEYTTAVNQTAGLFAQGQSQEYMVLNRIYNTTYDAADTNASTYIEPEFYNKIFATTGNQEQNFWVQIGCKIEARRVMAAKQIPNF